MVKALETILNSTKFLKDFFILSTLFSTLISVIHELPSIIILFYYIFFLKHFTHRDSIYCYCRIFLVNFWENTDCFIVTCIFFCPFSLSLLLLFSIKLIHWLLSYHTAYFNIFFFLPGHSCIFDENASITYKYLMSS